MDNRVLQFRIAMSPTPRLSIYPDHPQPFLLGDRNVIKSEIRRFLTSFQENDGPTANMMQDIVDASQRVQAAVFSNPATAHQVTQLLAGTGPIVKVLTEDEDALQIPWELFTDSPTTQNSGYQHLWGYERVFLRTCTKWQTPLARREMTVVQSKEVGFLAYDPITAEATDGSEEDLVLRTLSNIQPESQLHFSGRLRPNEANRSRTLEWLSTLDFAHLRCLIVSFKYGKEVYLVFSDAFLVSLSEIKKGLRFRQESMVFLDAHDNTWHLMKERFLFLQSLIAHSGGAGVVTSFVPLPLALAESFSSCFYERLAANGSTSLYDALQRARQALLEREGDLLTFLFWLYGNPEAEVIESSQQRRRKRCDRSKLSAVIDNHCTEPEARRFHLRLRAEYESLIPRRYEDLRGPSLWNRVENLLEIWETRDDLCSACEIYLKEIRQDRELREALEGSCDCRGRLNSIP